MGFYIIWIVVGIVLALLCLIFIGGLGDIHNAFIGWGMVFGFISFFMIGISLSALHDYVIEIVPDFKVLEAEYKYNKVLEKEGVIVFEEKADE